MPKIKGFKVPNEERQIALCNYWKHGAEIIYNRVDSKKENMGLTTWENSPDGKISFICC